MVRSGGIVKRQARSKSPQDYLFKNSSVHSLKRDWKKSECFLDFKEQILAEVERQKNQKKALQKLQQDNVPIKNVQQLKRLLDGWGVTGKNLNKQQKYFIWCILQECVKEKKPLPSFGFKNGPPVRQSQIDSILKLQHMTFEEDEIIPDCPGIEVYSSMDIDAEGEVVEPGDGIESLKITAGLRPVESFSANSPVSLENENMLLCGHEYITSNTAAGSLSPEMDTSSDDRDTEEANWSDDTMPDESSATSPEEAAESSSTHFVVANLGLMSPPARRISDIDPSSRGPRIVELGDEPEEQSDLAVTCHQFEKSIKSVRTVSEPDEQTRLDGYANWTSTRAAETFKPKLDIWIAEHRHTAVCILEALHKDSDNTGDEIEICYERFVQNQKATRGLEWEGSLFPLDMYTSMWVDQDPRQKPEPTQEEKNESAKILSIFEEHFPAMLKAWTHDQHGYSLNDSKFETAIVHIPFLIKEFGPSHIFVLRAISKMAHFLYSMGDRHCQATIQLTSLIILKLKRMGMESHGVAIEDLQLLAKALQSADNKASALTASKMVYDLCRAIYDEGAFTLIGAMIEFGRSLIENGRRDQGMDILAKSTRYLEKNRREIESPSASCIVRRARNFRNIGGIYAKAGHKDEALNCLRSSADYYKDPVVHEKRKNLLYYGTAKLGEAFAELKDYNSALEMYEMFLIRRTGSHGLHDSKALKIIKKATQIMDLRGFVRYASLIRKRAIEACEKKMVRGRVYYSLIQREDGTLCNITIDEESLSEGYLDPYGWRLPW